MICCFTRSFNNVNIKVYIEFEFYKMNSNILDIVFFTFIKEIYNVNNIVSKNSIVVIPITKTQKYLLDFNNKIICNNLEKNWILKLIGDLEEWYANILDCTIFHGSCINLRNKTILLIGARKHGKTTLTSYLVVHKNATYLDDDCVYLYNNELFGFNMPISVREDVDRLSKENLICVSIDGENITRKLFNAPKKTLKLPSIDIIIFPKYNRESTNEIELIQKKDLFNMIINNIRHSKDSKSLFVDISKIVKNVEAYNITYSSSEIAYNMINTIINHGEK